MLSGSMSTARTIPLTRTYSRPWLMVIHFSPRTNRLPFGQRFATVTVISPKMLLLWRLDPEPSKDAALSTPAEN